jgi:uncharacterized membrane protein YhaH (DUF805 family)
MDTKTLLFSFEGRINRSTYWLRFTLPYIVIFLVLHFLDKVIGTLDSEGKAGLLSGLFVLLAIYPSIAVNVKRCHDRNRTGWFLLVGVIPLVNLWPFIELCFVAGTTGPNRYGPDPNTAR